MHIIYYSAYPENYFNTVINAEPKLLSHASQKFNYDLVQGFHLNGIQVDVICPFHALAYVKKESISKVTQMQEGDIHYYICPYDESSFKNRWLRKQSIRNLMKQLQRQDTIVFMDYLFPGAEIVTKYAKRLCVLITDLPESLYIKGNYLVRNYKIKRKEKLLTKANAFVLLADTMKEKISSTIPSITIEGMVNTTNRTRRHLQSNNPYCVYAGAITKECGVDRLVQAYSLLETDIPLKLYGNGNYAEELKMMHHPAIQFFGSVSNDKVLEEEEEEALLLINPRPSDSEFSKYSFPSKIMQYMASGTATITTRLQSMPKEYEPYLLFFENDSVEGIKKGLAETLTKNQNALDSLGEQAQAFVLTNKTNTAQAAKIIHFLTTLFE